MSTLMQRGLSLRNRATASVTAIPVVYIRGVKVIDGVLAVPVEVRDVDFGEDVIQLTARERDWLILADDLVISGSPIVPERGDIIQWFDSREQSHRYEVLPRAGERCYRFTENSMTQLRVFTVEAAA